MKINTKPLPGMMELLPEEQIEFNRIKNIIELNYAKFGFSSIDTPVIERTEVLLAKAGGETEKQIYRFKKGDNDLSLRFDLTVPTARYVADNIGQLQLPFKRSQIGKVYRGERSQRGRFREFYQCDIDVIGREKLSVNYDAEVISVIYSIFRELNFGDFTIRISNRNIISGLIGGLGVEDKSSEIMALIDRAEKISSEEFAEQLNNLDLGEKSSVIVEFINISGSCKDVLNSLKDMSKKINNEHFNNGIAELSEVSSLLKNMGVPERYFKLDMLIVRGLDYYTGTVFETNLDNFKQIGSVSSGGRYDNLTSYYSKEKLPGVGASIGLTRLFWCLRDLNLLSFNKRSEAEYLVIPMGGEQELKKSFEIANEMRAQGKKVEVLLENFNMKKAFKFADKRGVRYTLVIGDREILENSFFFKDMKTGRSISLEEIFKK